MVIAAGIQICWEQGTATGFNVTCGCYQSLEKLMGLEHFNHSETFLHFSFYKKSA